MGLLFIILIQQAFAIVPSIRDAKNCNGYQSPIQNVVLFGPDRHLDWTRLPATAIPEIGALFGLKADGTEVLASTALVIGSNCDTVISTVHQKYKDGKSRWDIYFAPGGQKSKAIKESEELYAGKSFSTASHFGEDLRIFKIQKPALPTAVCNKNFRIASFDTIQNLKRLKSPFEVSAIFFTAVCPDDESQLPDGSCPGGAKKTAQKRFQSCQAQNPNFKGAYGYGENIFMLNCHDGSDKASGGVISVYDPSTRLYYVVGIFNRSLTPTNEDWQPYNPYEKTRNANQAIPLTKEFIDVMSQYEPDTVGRPNLTQ